MTITAAELEFLEKIKTLPDDERKEIMRSLIHAFNANNMTKRHREAGSPKSPAKRTRPFINV
jgi:hypothetical protein